MPQKKRSQNSSNKGKTGKSERKGGQFEDVVAQPAAKSKKKGNKKGK